MRPRLFSTARSGDVSLPSEVERLLLDMVDDGFVVYCCGPKAAPSALLACYQWKKYVDLVTIRRVDRVTTARAVVPHHGRVDVFAPEAVVWAYEGLAQCALRALFDLVHPDHPAAPVSAYPAPPSLRISPAEQRPTTIRLPAPRQAGMRDFRLTVAMAAGGSRSTMAESIVEECVR